MFSMPGESHRGPLPPLTDAQTALADELRRDVVALSTTIGERNHRHPERYLEAAQYIEQQFEQAGFTPSRHTCTITGAEAHNIIVELPGATSPESIVVIGAHYDSVAGTVGANDNASGVAALLAIARRLAEARPANTLRLIAFANEEPPYFQTPMMGSHQYAQQCRERDEQIIAMVAFDGLGYYSDEPDSQHYPPPMNLLYPSTGDFIGFVSDLSSRDLTRRCIGVFREHAAFPSEGGCVPRFITGAGWSDHWSFWQFDYPAAMVTDSLPFRYAHYHTPADTADKLDYDRMARVTEGLLVIVRDLAEIE